jgi:alpha-galactosidase
MRFTAIIISLLFTAKIFAQQHTLAAKPPMGWMSWNLLADNITEQDVRSMADAMVSSGMVKAGYDYIFIDDGWQGGRDKKNNIIPDPIKFPSGIKALAAYVHQRGIKLGIYSDAAPLTCAGYTASLHFEQQDAKTFASWDIDFLKYDYCGAPEDVATAKARYTTMGNALKKSGRDIVFSVCEWGPRKPWLWAAEAGGNLWRTTYDIRDKWKRKTGEDGSEGIWDIYEVTVALHNYSGPGKWNDADMLVAGLYGKKGPSSYKGGNGCTQHEYQSQFSLWAMMNSPLYVSCDIRTMDEQTKNILLNEAVIAINQDESGKQAERKINNTIWDVLVKPLANGDYAVAVLNKADTEQTAAISFNEIGLTGKYAVTDLWQHKLVTKGKNWKGKIAPHETKLFRLTPQQ